MHVGHVDVAATYLYGLTGRHTRFPFRGPQQQGRYRLFRLAREGCDNLRRCCRRVKQGVEASARLSSLPVLLLRIFSSILPELLKPSGERHVGQGISRAHAGLAVCKISTLSSMHGLTLSKALMNSFPS